MRIPLLIYDVGGVTEMIDPKQHADIICGTPKVTRPSVQPTLGVAWKLSCEERAPGCLLHRPPCQQYRCHCKLAFARTSGNIAEWVEQA